MGSDNLLIAAGDLRPDQLELILMAHFAFTWSVDGIVVFGAPLRNELLDGPIAKPVIRSWLRECGYSPEPWQPWQDAIEAIAAGRRVLWPHG